MRKLIAVLVVCCVLPALPSASSAEYPSSKPKAPPQDSGCMSPAGCPRIALMLTRRQELKLSDDQVSRLTALQNDLAKENSATLADAKNAQTKLNDMMAVTSPDFNAVKDQMKKASDLQLKAQTAKVDCYSKGYGLLSDQQKQQFNQLWAASEKEGK